MGARLRLAVVANRQQESHAFWQGLNFEQTSNETIMNIFASLDSPKYVPEAMRAVPDRVQGE